MTEYISIRIRKGQIREQGHFFIDLIVNNGFMTRSEIYLWLSSKINLSEQECHFSRLKRNKIIECIQYCMTYLNERYTLHDLPHYKIL